MKSGAIYTFVTAANVDEVVGYAGEIEYFVDCITKGIEPTKVTPESSEGSVRLVERILASAIRVEE